MSAEVRQPGAHDLLSVDVWDTLLRRRCHPDGVKLHVCRYLRLRYAADLPSDRRDPWVLLRLRQQAEKELGEQSRARGLDDEYGHLDVYRHWLRLAGLDPFPGGEAALEPFLTELEQTELAQEKYVSYVDPGIAQTLSRLSARRVLFLSDFYLPGRLVHELLAHHGIGHWVEDGLVSCDVGLNKRSGRLFRHLHSRFGAEPGRHVHVGDNAHADIKAARALGIEAVHYQPALEHENRRQREAMFRARGDALRQAVEASMPAAGGAPGAHPEAYAYGRRCALLCIGFVWHVLENALTDRVERLYYFTREGEFFLAIHRRLAELDAFGLPLPPAQLLHVSRLATFAGSLREFSPTELMRLWNQYSVQSLSALCKSLGMEAEALAAAAARHGLDLTTPIRYPWQDARVLALFGEAAVRADGARQLANKRGDLLAYLCAAGLEDQPARIGIVDIGWRGTIQDNLAYTLPAVTWRGYYLALNRFLNPQPANAGKSAFGPNLNLAEEAGHLLDFVAPVEMLCNSPNGSVTGYEVTAAGVRPHRHVDDEENRIHEECVRAFQAGVLDAVPFWADFLRTHAYSAEELRPLALEIWSGIIGEPPPFLASAYFRLNHNETFGMGGFSDKRHLPGVAEVWRALVSRRARERLHRFLRENGWVPGLLACPEVDPALRRSLRVFLKALAIKRRLRRWRGRLSG